MKEKWEWHTKDIQIIKDIIWLLKKRDRAESPKEKEKYLTKIQNWKKVHPYEAQQLDKHLRSLSGKRSFSIINRKEKLIENIIKTF